MDLQRVFSVLCFATLLLPCTVLATTITTITTTPEPGGDTNETSSTITTTITTTTPTPATATAASNNGSGDGDLGRGIGIGVGIMLGVLAIMVILMVIFLWRRGWVLHLRLPCNRASDMEQPLDPPSKNGKNGPKVYTKQTSDEGITNPVTPPPPPSSPPPADDSAGAKHTDLQRSNTYEVPQANYVSERQYEGLTRQTPSNASQRPTSETPSENYEDPEKVEALQPKPRESRASKQSPGTSAQLYKQFKEDKKKDGRKSAKPAARAPPDGGAAGEDDGPGVMDEFYENCEFDAKNPSAKMPERQSHSVKAHPTFASEEVEARAKVTRLPSAPGDDVYMDMDGTGHASGIRPPSMDDVYQNTDEALSTDLKMSFKM